MGTLQIPLILGSIRRGRQSERVAKFIVERMRASSVIQTELIDLLDLNLPMMEERLSRQPNAPASVVAFGEKIRAADGVMIVSPEYNNGYPGVLKNALDYLLPEYKRKPMGIVTVSAGGFGGLHVLTQLRLVAFGMGAFPIPAQLPISKVQDAFDAEGKPTDPTLTERADKFIREMVWFTEAIASQKAKSPPLA